MIWGNRRKKIILNLPGSISYDSSIPWVFKKEWNNKIAIDLFFYIDDERPTPDGTLNSLWKGTLSDNIVVKDHFLNNVSREFSYVHLDPTPKHN